MIDENLAVHVGFGEAVVCRRQFVVVLYFGGDAERIEIGMQMAAHAVGADHHDRANRILRRALSRDQPALGDGFRPWRQLSPSACQLRWIPSASCRRAPRQDLHWPEPASWRFSQEAPAALASSHQCRIVGKAGEKRSAIPAANRCRIFLPAGVQAFLCNRRCRRTETRFPQNSSFTGAAVVCHLDDP